MIDDGLTSRKRRATLLDPAFQYIGIGTSMHRTQGIVTVIILAEDSESLVAPGKDGYYSKREMIKNHDLSKMIFTTVKQNERNHIEKSAY